MKNGLRATTNAKIVTVGSVNNYIEESLRTSPERTLFNKITVFVKDPLPEDVDLDYVLSSIEKKVPEHLIYGIDMIYIGQFEEFEKCRIQRWCSLYNERPIRRGRYD